MLPVTVLRNVQHKLLGVVFARRVAFRGARQKELEFVDHDVGRLREFFPPLAEFAVFVAKKRVVQ